MKFEIFYPSKLRNTELVSLVTNVIKITRAYNWEESKVSVLYQNLINSDKIFRGHIHKFGTAIETSEVRKADAELNNSWRAYKYVCKVYELSADKDERVAAKEMIELNRVHDYNLHKRSYHIQNTNAELFLKNCKEKETVKAAIEKLGIQKFIDRIEAALNNLNIALVNRQNKYVSEKRENDTKELRKKLYENLVNLFKYMEAISAITPHGEMDNMIKLINESINKINLSIKLRSAHRNGQELKSEKAEN